MTLVEVTAPALLPVTLSELKTHLRIDHSDEDTTISGYLKAARERCELEARRTFINTTYDMYLDAWPRKSKFTLPRPPIVSVTGVYYTDDEGDETEYSSANYLVDIYSEPGRIVLRSTAAWPSVTLQEINGVRVRFVAGYGTTPAAVPERYRQAIMLTAGHFYENREGVLVAQGYNAIVLPDAVRNLLGIDRGRFF